MGPKNQIPTDALEQQGRAGSSEKPTDAPLRAMIESFSLLRKDKKKARAESNRTSWEVRKAPDSAHRDLFNHLVGNQQKVATNCQTKRSSRLQIYH